MKEHNITRQTVFDEAVKHLDEKNYDAAIHGLNFLLDHNREEALVIYMLANCFEKKGYYALAEILLKKAIELDPSNHVAYNNLGCIYKKTMRLKEAHTAFETAIKNCDKDTKDTGGKLLLPGYYNNIGSLYVNNGTPDKAIEYYDKALAMVPDDPDATRNKAFALLEKRMWKEGWHYWDYDKSRKNRECLKHLPRWNGETGKTVLVYGEQGLGDEIMFASMLPDLMKKCNVIIDAHPRLANTFRYSFPGVPIYGSRKQPELSWLQFHNIDCELPMGSLGKFFRNSDSDFPKTPYLKAKPFTGYQLAKDKLNIGISWIGGIERTYREYRSMPLEAWGGIVTQEANFISLQYTQRARDEVKAVNEKLGINIQHWQDVIDDYEWTFELVNELDLVITVCTSLLHVAGSLGKDCWLLTPSRPPWTCAIKGDYPWYASVKQHRQIGGDWQTVLTKIQDNLCNLLVKNTKN